MNNCVTLVAQTVRDYHLAARSTHKRSATFSCRILAKTEGLLRRLADPTVTYKIGTSTLTLPLSHRLPLYRVTHPEYDQNLARIAAIAYSFWPEMAAVDIGANIGDSVAHMRLHASFPILCIEGNQAYFPFLLENTAHFNDVDCTQTYIGVGDITINGVADTQGGTARIVNCNNSSSITFKSLDSVLGEWQRADRVKLLKIDTDGYDTIILNSSRDVIQRLKPILFFEYDPKLIPESSEPAQDVFALLRDCGYTNFLVYKNTGELYSALDSEDRTAIRLLIAQTGRTVDYFDIAAYHSESQALFEQTLSSEIEHLKSVYPTSR